MEANILMRAGIEPQNRARRTSAIRAVLSRVQDVSKNLTNINI